MVFHNGSTLDYHFIIKESAEELETQFECLGENTEKYITFSVPIKKKLDNGKSITFKSIQLNQDLQKYMNFVTNILINLFCY